MKAIIFLACSLFIFPSVKEQEIFLKSPIISAATVSNYHPVPVRKTMKTKYFRKINKSIKNDNIKSINYNSLFQYGVAEAFIGGVFEGNYPINELLKQGSFGIGAPSLIDGELIVVNGHAYQTQSTGETIEVPGNLKTSLAFVTFFKPDTVLHISGMVGEKQAFLQIEKYLKKKNAAYAIKISGNFNEMKTRAFPKNTVKPYPPLATLLDQQKFFDISNTSGSLVGFKLPSYLNVLSIDGFHFHFLSDDKSKGGHLITFKGMDLQVEIAEMKSFRLEIPQDSSFMNYDFKRRQNIDLEKVEKGH